MTRGVSTSIYPYGVVKGESFPFDTPPGQRPVGSTTTTTNNKNETVRHDRHRRGGPRRLCGVAAASRVRFARARHAHSASLRCAWLRAALDPDVRSASLAWNVKVASKGDKTNIPLYRTLEVAEIACPTSHPLRLHRAESAFDPMESRFSEAQALSRTAAWPPA